MLDDLPANDLLLDKPSNDDLLQQNLMLNKLPVDDLPRADLMLCNIPTSDLLKENSLMEKSTLEKETLLDISAMNRDLMSNNSPMGNDAVFEKLPGDDCLLADLPLEKPPDPEPRDADGPNALTGPVLEAVLCFAPLLGLVFRTSVLFKRCEHGFQNVQNGLTNISTEGCGPYYGRTCETLSVDLRNAHSGSTWA